MTWIVFDLAAVRPKEQRHHINCIQKRSRAFSTRKVIIDENCLPLVTVTFEPDLPFQSDIGLVGLFQEQYRYLIHREAAT